MQSAFEFYRDLPARPKRPERLFFGLRPDPETALRIDQFRRRLLDEKRWNGTPLKTERLHVSLHHVGDYRRLQSQFLYAARQAAAAVSMRPFAVTLRFIKSVENHPATEGRTRKPLVLLAEADALLELHNILGVAMKKSGLRAAEHFTQPPHMTLSYKSRDDPRTGNRADMLCGQRILPHPQRTVAHATPRARPVAVRRDGWRIGALSSGRLIEWE
jgi:2'-5' RNA ligase